MAEDVSEQMACNWQAPVPVHLWVLCAAQLSLRTQEHCSPRKRDPHAKTSTPTMHAPESQRHPLSKQEFILMRPCKMHLEAESTIALGEVKKTEKRHCTTSLTCGSKNIKHRETESRSVGARGWVVGEWGAVGPRSQTQLQGGKFQGSKGQHGDCS